MEEQRRLTSVATNVPIGHMSSTSCPRWPAPPHHPSHPHHGHRWHSWHLTQCSSFGIIWSLSRTDSSLPFKRPSLGFCDTTRAWLSSYFTSKSFSVFCQLLVFLPPPKWDWILSALLSSHYAFCLSGLFHYLGFFPHIPKTPQLPTTQTSTLSP